jgi:two-component system sensor histidine kinase KdpD
VPGPPRPVRAYRTSHVTGRVARLSVQQMPRLPSPARYPCFPPEMELSFSRSGIGLLMRRATAGEAMNESLRDRLRRIWITRPVQTAAGIAVVTATTYLFSRLVPVNAATVGFVYLVLILLIATSWGFFEAVCASIVAVLLFNYHFLPPVGRFTIADPQNWVAVFAFLITAIVAGQLSAKARRQAQEAVRRGAEVERLYSFSRAILLADTGQPAGDQIARQIALVFECPAVAVYDALADTIHLGGQRETPELVEPLRAAAVRGTYTRDDSKPSQVIPVRLGGQPIGSLALSGIRMPEPILDSLASLVAIGLERARSQEATSRAEAARRSEELKSTLLDSIAHEFKTPLTSIKAAASGLLENPDAPSADRKELAAIVNEEADRLSRLVTEAIQMSGIEAGRIRLDRKLWKPADLVNRALSGFEHALSGRSVQVRISEHMPMVEVDADLMTVALRHLFDNAAKYSPAGTPIEIAAEERNASVVLMIADSGAGISEQEQDRVFEKYYRSDRHKDQIPGSGMGLSIARDIVRLHRGEIWAEAGAGAGSVLCIALPSVKGPRK